MQMDELENAELATLIADVGAVISEEALKAAEVDRKRMFRQALKLLQRLGSVAEQTTLSTELAESHRRSVSLAIRLLLASSDAMAVIICREVGSARKAPYS